MTALRTRRGSPVRSAELDALVEYEAAWYRHGGGADLDIWDRFGLSPREYFARVLGALDTHGGHLQPATVAGIRSVARRRLWLAS